PRLLSAHSGQHEAIDESEAQDIKLNNEDNWDHMFEAMRKVISSPHGTARVLQKHLEFSIAGKTCTAQVVGIKQDEEYD
ncbi:hypothetical protein Q4595_30225, partial [Wenyingzhuangia sp. 1_MG-2023]|nr:hypothetical protein [Wenyingzhuangia sp. 1_MG-2023]